APRDHRPYGRSTSTWPERAGNATLSARVQPLRAFEGCREVMRHSAQRDLLAHPDHFVDRHIGPREEDLRRMLETLGLSSLDQLAEHAVPASIRLGRALAL